jgi:hypothetical protein
MFASYEIKIAIACICTTFERFHIDDDKLSINYFSPSAMAEIHVPVRFVPLVKKYKVNNIKVKNIENKGWLIKNFMSLEKQEEIYNYTIQLSEESNEQKTIKNIPLEKPYPITYYNLVYTGESNCKEPTKWINLGNKVWKFMHDYKDLIGFNITENYNFDSVYCQLYGKGGFMKGHYDEFVSCGISISLGHSCKFGFDGREIILKSGDIFVSDFSKNFHSIDSIIEGTAPDWFSKADTFGRLRFSAQIRSVKNCLPAQLISKDDFIGLINA